LAALASILALERLGISGISPVAVVDFSPEMGLILDPAAGLSAKDKFQYAYTAHSEISLGRT
jgi:hypothetical protein